MNNLNAHCRNIRSFIEEHTLLNACYFIETHIYTTTEESSAEWSTGAACIGRTGRLQLYRMKLGLENRQSPESKFPLPSPHRAVFQPVNRRSRACKRSSPAAWGAGKSETFCSELKDGQKLWKGLPLAFRVGYQSGRQWCNVHRPNSVAFTRGHGSLGQISEGLFKRLCVYQRTLQYF